jgi:hypothetical protein
MLARTAIDLTWFDHWQVESTGYAHLLRAAVVQLRPAAAPVPGCTFCLRTNQPTTSLDLVLRLLLNCISNLCRWTLYLFRLAMAYCSDVA